MVPLTEYFIDVAISHNLYRRLMAVLNLSLTHGARQAFIAIIDLKVSNAYIRLLIHPSFKRQLR